MEELDVVICGHIHEAHGQDTIGVCTIVNRGTAAKGYYAPINISAQIEILDTQFSK